MVDPVSAREIAVSGLRAQRTRMNVIANNIANAQTTRTPEGGAFRRQLTVLAGNQIGPGTNPAKLGVRVKSVVGDTTALRSVYEPNHPDANAEGYVSYPNITIAAEMVDMISAQRAYEANIAVIVSGSRMRERAMQILQQ